jgi:hypothetical protein
LTADASPFVGAILLHDDIGVHEKCAVGRFCQPESFVSSSIGHGRRDSNGRAMTVWCMEEGELVRCPRVSVWPARPD